MKTTKEMEGTTGTISREVFTRELTSIREASANLTRTFLNRITATDANVAELVAEMGPQIMLADKMIGELVRLSEHLDSPLYFRAWLNENTEVLKLYEILFGSGREGRVVGTTIGVAAMK